MSQPRLPGRCALSPLPTQLQGPPPPAVPPHRSRPQGLGEGVPTPTTPGTLPSPHSHFWGLGKWQSEACRVSAACGGEASHGFHT